MQKLTITLSDSFTILKWVLGVLFVFLVFSLLVQGGANREATDRNYRLGKENNTYHRTIACILSVPIADRTNDYISNCYLRAEQHNDTQVDHFGNK